MKNVTCRQFSFILENSWIPYGGGQHHFPESCGITEEEFENIVNVTNKILSEKSVEPQLVEEFEYYVRLYQTYFEWQRNNRNGDFYELCNRNGLEFV